MNQKMVSIVSFLLGGAFSTVCFCRSMKVEPLLANNLRRLITESSLRLATAKSAWTRSYLHFRIKNDINKTHFWPVCFPQPLKNIVFEIQILTRDERRLIPQPSLYSCERL